MLHFYKKNYYLILSLIILAIHQLIFLDFIPNKNGFLGHDFEYFLPNFLFGKIWFTKNFLSIPWFSPSFCCGVPFYPDPQTMFYSLQQIFYIYFDPILATKILFLYFSIISYVGMYLLLNKNFYFNSDLSILGATLFLFNGFFVYRFIIGHLGYVNFTLIPIYCFFLISSIQNKDKNLKRISLIASSLILSICIYSGVSFFIVFIILISFVILLIFNIKYSNFLLILKNYILSLVIFALLSISKISAAFFFIKNFERGYEPVYFDRLLDYLYLTVKSLFLFPDSSHIINSINNGASKILLHEIEFGVSIIPLFCLFIFIFNFQKFKNFKFVNFFMIILILLIPIILNTNLFSINKIWNSIPLVGNSWMQVRWNILYIIPLIIFSIFVLNRSYFFLKKKLSIILFISIIICQSYLYDKNYYYSQNYDPSNIVELEKSYNEKESFHSILGIGVVVDDLNNIINTKKISMDKGGIFLNQRNDLFKINLSSFNCYQPIYGYLLEKFPQAKLKFDKKNKISAQKFLLSGNARSLDRFENYNFLNPACLIFPDENNCAEGYNFKKKDEDKINSFLNYEKFKFEMKFIQHIFNYLSLTIFVISIIFLLINFYLYLMRIKKF